MAKKPIGSRSGRMAPKPKAAKKSTIIRLKSQPPTPTGVKKPAKTDAQKKSKKAINKAGKQVRQAPVPLVRTFVRQLRIERAGVAFPTVIRNVPYEPQIVNSFDVRLLRYRGGRILLPAMGKQEGKYERYHKGIGASTKTVDAKGSREWKQVIFARDHNYQGPLHKCPQIVLHCQCQDFVFGGWEYALWFHGGAQIINGNGEKPTKNNTALKPGCCKHLFVVYHKLKAEGL